MGELDRIKIIAEIGINHNGIIENVFKLIDAAVFSGFDYVKFQKRNPDICVPEDQKNKMKKTPWGEMTYLEYKYKMEFSREQYLMIDHYCVSKGIDWFASVWDLDSAKEMIDFCDIIKIPSALITNIELLEFCRDNYYTVIISTGMSTQEEIDRAACFADVILHCCAAYPAKSEDLFLDYILYLKDNFDQEIGYSGHEEGLTTSFAACAMGIEWLERHITLDHSMWGSDQRASIDPVGMLKLIRGVREIEKSLYGYGDREVLECELEKRESLRK